MSQTKLLTNVVLKGIMSDALVYRGENPDLDSLKTPGVYLLKNIIIADELYPYGFLRVMAAGSFVCHEYIPHHSATSSPGEAWAAKRTGDYAKRVSYLDEWTPWVIFKGSLAT